MLRKDFILLQIEAFAKAIAQLITKRKGGDFEQADLLLKLVYSSLGIDKDYLFSHTPDEIRTFLDREDKAGMQRMEMAAKILVEDSYIKNDKASLFKAQEILQYVQKHDLTFSIERMNLLAEIQDLLSKS